MPKAVNAYVGLGSNLGDREALLRFALEALNAAPNLTIEAVSRVYETDPVGPGEQGAYLNAAVSIQTLLSAEQLLECLLAIELQAGRDRAGDVVQAQERIRFRLDPMFTTLEGDMSEVYALISDMQEAVFAAGATRVSTVIKIDDRRDRAVSMEDKVKSALDKTQIKTANR